MGFVLKISNGFHVLNPMPVGFEVAIKHCGIRLDANFMGSFMNGQPCLA